MRPRRFVVLAGVFLFVLCLSDTFGSDKEHKEYIRGFALSKSVERSSLIVVGRVIGKEFVFRENIETLATTDIIIAADEVIKGTPNAGKDRVKFMLEGGRVVNPNTGEGINLYVTHQPEFAVGERILLFMVNSTDPYFKDYPYDRFHPYRGEYGKRVIKDDKVFIWFVLDDDSLEGLKGIRMPLDLAVKLCKAADKDKDAMVQLENDIKDAIEQHAGSKFTLSQTLIDRLMEEAEEIIGRNTENENQDSQPQNDPEDENQ